MAKLGGLINGQDLAFDTHQGGDGQESKWQKVHLEKRLHNRRGKVRFPLLGDEKPSNSGMSQKDFERVTVEVKNALKKNEDLLNELASTIVEQLKRFSSGKATIIDAEVAAKRFAEYFNLDTEFVKKVATYARNKNLQALSTIHYNAEEKTFHEIKQSKSAITIKKIQEPKYKRKNPRYLDS